MSRHRPPLIRLSDLEPGRTADFFALLSERTRGQTHNGRPYFACRFRDARRSVAFMVWADGGFFADCERSWQAGQCFKIRGRLATHDRYGLQLDAEQIRTTSDADRADGFDPADLAERNPADPAALPALRELVATELADLPLRTLVLLLLDRHADRLRILPASPRHYYPYPGGWAAHTLSVARACLALADHFRRLRPDVRLSRDALLAGATLHEIGRVAELEGDPPARTVVGRLHGHVLLGRDLVRDAAREVEGLRPDQLLLVEHLILTHLQLPEWGSPRLPAAPECLILHHADDLDAKFEMYARCLENDPTPGPFTERDPILGRPLWRGPAEGGS